MAPLPDQDHLDEVEGRLAELTEAVDAVQLITYRAGVIRTLPPTDETGAMLADLTDGWPGALAELVRQLEVAGKWARQELQSAT